MKLLVYHLVRNCQRILAYFYFGKVEVVGKEKIPKGKPIIYSSNHQNSFMDALIIGGFVPNRMTSLTRSDVFGSHAGMWFMSALHMLPIYRMQDGMEKLARNEKTFELVRKRLRKGQGVLIFSEGNHGNEYYLRTLSKGSSRMALQSQEQMMEHDIQVVPVGVNYYHHQQPLHKFTLAFGDPISVKDYMPSYSDQPARATNQLKSAIAAGMQDCLMLPENTAEYFEKKPFINRKNEIPFREMKKRLSSGEGLNPPGKNQPLLRKLAYLFWIPNFLPYLLLRRICRSVKDIVFHASFKWASALLVLPLWWVLIVVGLGVTLSWRVGFIYLAVAFLSVYVSQLLVRWSNPPH